MTYSKWQSQYQEAVSESDPEVIPERIARAEAAIHSRLKQLTRQRRHEFELSAIRDALDVLRRLKRRYFPGWNRS